MMVAVGGRFAVTVSVAELLVALPNVLVTTARKVAPLSASCADASVYVGAVAPAMFAPSRCHWNASGAVPDALTLKDAAWPAETVRLAGCDVISGAWSSVNSTRQTEPVPRSRYHKVPSLASVR